MKALAGTTKGEYHCRPCDYVREVFDGKTEVAIRLTVQPERVSDEVRRIVGILVVGDLK